LDMEKIEREIKLVESTGCNLALITEHPKTLQTDC